MADAALIERVEVLERRVRGLTMAAGGAVVALCGVLMFGAGPEAMPEEPGALTVTRLVVVDDQGRPRVVIGQDPADTQRMSRAAGITLHDSKGTERGGFSTMADGSVVLGLDAPAGVGSPMGDRIGLRVESTGAASIALINNQTGIPVRLVSEADGSGGIEFIDYDLEAKKAFIKRVGFKGESVTEQGLGG